MNQTTAETLGSTGQISTRLIELLRAGSVDEAAALYSRLSEDIGYLLVQKHARDAGLNRRMAKMFYLAKDYAKAALVFEEAGEYDKAAKLYVRADDYGMAAEMFAKVEDFANAALMYEKNGNYATAAELYQQVGDLVRAAANFEKAVNHFRAGKMYAELGKDDKAVELLQQVRAEDPNYLEAVRVTAEILGRKGHAPVAVMKLQSLLTERGLDEDGLDAALTLARLALSAGDRELARQWLQRILEIRFPYKDAAELLAAIDDPAVSIEAAPAEIEIIEEAELVEEDAPVVALEADFETIRDAPLFQELNLQELKKFWTLVMPLDFRDGEIIIEQNEPGTGLYIISSGRVRVSRVDEETEQTLAELGAGAHLGEMSLLDDAPTSARVTALGDVTAFLMPKDAFQQLIASDDRLARKIYQAFAATLMERLRDTNAQFRSWKQKKETEMADLFGIRE
ncbi:MAG: hypothetical protein D6761_11620 [Candidatus Dadabacteria bacterium]|nr:MAG: hypothetical protein D6761_11620 [Candidatus Dadabacteria bacterium]